jgi:membrane associated rhomboid family serine protease
MSLGFGIFLMAVGAILAFAVNVTTDWIALTTVGYILIAAGALITILGIVLLMRKRQSVSTSRTTVDPASGSTTQRSVRDDTL